MVGCVGAEEAASAPAKRTDCNILDSKVEGEVTGDIAWLWVPSSFRISIAEIKHHDQKLLRDVLAYMFSSQSIMKGSQGRNSR